MPLTTDLDTELSAVNSILGSIGQSPVTVLNFTNPEIQFIYNILTEVTKDVQNEGWQFNLEEGVSLTIDANSPDHSGTAIGGNTAGAKINVPANVLRYNVHNLTVANKLVDTVIRHDTADDGTLRVFDLENNRFFWALGTYKTDLVTLYAFEKIPNVFQRYITYRSAVRAATQLLSNPQLVQLLQVQEVTARANCLEYEGNQGDHSFFGLPNAKRLHSQILSRNPS